MREKAAAGADVRVIRSREGFQRETARLPPVQRNYPVRLVSDARIFLPGRDDVGSVFFPTPAGKVDIKSMLLFCESAGHSFSPAPFTPLLRSARCSVWPP